MDVILTIEKFLYTFITQIKGDIQHYMFDAFL